jgi:hypothetical protein
MRTHLGLPSGLVRRTAQLLLLALSVTTLGPLLHDTHDPDWEAFVIHDEREHNFHAAPSSDGPSAADHCVACHFVRTSRGPVSWEPAGLHDLGAGTRVFHSDRNLFAALAERPRSARAPPTA